MTRETFRKKGDRVTVRAAGGYLKHAEKLLIMTNTGNGFIAKFPSCSTAHQDNFVCLDYSEADYLWKALSCFYGAEKSQPIMNKYDAMKIETQCIWQKETKRWVCKFCGKQPETFYVVTGHDHTDSSIWTCECREHK